jgi:hypothetical protein
VKSRRASTTHMDYARMSKSRFFFQHILGEVLEETSFLVIPDVEVSLLYKGKESKMIDSTWENPYNTNYATKGFYHFWPEFHEGDMDEKSPVPFKIIFKHPKFKEKSLNIELSVMDTFYLNKTHVVPLTLLQTQIGVDISFLYER